LFPEGESTPFEFNSKEGSKMIIFAELRADVGKAFIAGFEREGVAVEQMQFEEAEEWFSCASSTDLQAIEALLVGCGGDAASLTRDVRHRGPLPIVALSERRNLNETLALFGAGADDVVTKPVHAKELMARIRLIASRVNKTEPIMKMPGFIIQTDGHDLIVNGKTLALLRRERRVLSCLADARGSWMTKTQVFSHVYGLFNERIEENVVESHVSRLRKRLRERLGYEAIEAQRFMGYRLIAGAGVSMHVLASSEQVKNSTRL
jgi:DNA-binding response OmpR family regulator